MMKENQELSNLMQNLANAIGDREGRDALMEKSPEYVYGVIDALPKIEKALNEVKEFIFYGGDK